MSFTPGGLTGKEDVPTNGCLPSPTRTLESRQSVFAALLWCAVSPLGVNGEFKQGRFG